MDEPAYAGAEHLDPAYVATYEAKAGFDPQPEVSLLRALGGDRTQTLVDLGAGTGALALAAADVYGRVVAVDVSPAMAVVLRRRVRDDRAARVEVVQAGLLSYQHRGAPADVVYSRNALHQLPDFWKTLALHRIAAMLRPGGILRLRDLVFSVDPPDVDAVVEAWLGAAPADARAGWTRAELAAHVRGEHSTFSWLLEPMLERVGFTIEEASYDASKAFAAYVCRRT